MIIVIIIIFLETSVNQRGRRLTPLPLSDSVPLENTHVRN